MVPEDDECGCHVVRSLRSDLGVGIHVDNNSLILYNTKEYARSVITGGDIVSITTLVNAISCWFRFSGTIRFRPLGASETINVTMPPGSRRMLRIFGLPGGNERRVPASDGVQLDADYAVYLTADSSLIDGWDQPDMVLATNRNIDVLNRSGTTSLLCYRDDSDPNNRFMFWVPTGTRIPLRIPNETSVITYNIRTGRGSWTEDPDEIVEPVDPGESVMPFDFGKLMCHGGIITYSTVRVNETDFAFIRWSENIWFKNIGGSVARDDSHEGFAFVTMPNVGDRIPLITERGEETTSVVRDLGIEIGHRGCTLFYIWKFNDPRSIQPWRTRLENFRLVEMAAPSTVFKPTADWHMICNCEIEGVLKWMPSLVQIPRTLFGTTTYDTVRCVGSWQGAGTRSLPTITDVKSESQLLSFKNNDGVINIGVSNLESKLNTYNTNITTLTSKMNVVQSSMQQKRFIGMVVQFDDLSVLSQWGSQTLSTKKHLKRLSDGIIQITFPVATSNANYGVLLSMNIDGKEPKAGVIQYTNQQKTSVNILTFDLSGKPNTFCGNFTIEIAIP